MGSAEQNIESTHYSLYKHWFLAKEPRPYNVECNYSINNAEKAESIHIEEWN